MMLQADIRPGPGQSLPRTRRGTGQPRWRTCGDRSSRQSAMPQKPSVRFSKMATAKAAGPATASHVAHGPQDRSLADIPAPSQAHRHCTGRRSVFPPRRTQRGSHSICSHHLAASGPPPSLACLYKECCHRTPGRFQTGGHPSHDAVKGHEGCGGFRLFTA
jgi:hypothetical protein